MKLYILERDRANREEAVLILVRAENEQQARELANGCCGDEGEVWQDPIAVSCEEVPVTGGVDVLACAYS